VEAKQLKGHHSYTFVAGGTAGWACSEPKQVETIRLVEVLPERIVAAGDEAVLNVAERATQAMLSAHPSLSDKVEALRESADIVASRVTSPDVRERLRKFAFVVEVCQLLGISWLIAT